MAYTIVQFNHTRSTGSSATLNTFSSNVTAGNLLLCAYNVGNGSSITSITDGPGNTWTRINTEFNDTTNGQFYGWFYAANSKAGATTLTIAHTGTLAAQSYCICEVSGVATTTPLRQSDEPAGSSTTATGANALTGTSLTDTSGDFMVAMLDVSNAATNSAGTGFTLIAAEGGIAGATGSTAMEWKTSTGTDQATFTTTDSGNPYMVLTALFKPAAVAATVVIPESLIVAQSVMRSNLF